MVKTRVVFIGIDAATFSLIRPWAKEGKLPFFRKLMSESAYCDLLSTVPPVTVPAWQSMFSGMRPDRLGFAGFVNKKPGVNEFGLFSSRKWADKSILSLLSREGKRIVSINLPGTTPVWKINGIMVSGMLGSDSDPCYPPEFRKELKSVGYIIEGHGYDHAKKAFDARLRLLRKIDDDLDLLVFVIRYPDSISHRSVNDWEKYYLPCYKEVDSALAEIYTRFSDDHIMIASDHGTQMTGRNFYLNSWLARKGFLKVKQHAGAARVKRRVMQYTKILLDYLGLQSVKDFLNRFAGDPANERTEHSERIIFPESRAYAKGEGGTSNFGCIFINQDLVKRKDFNRFRQKIINQLKKEPEIERVWPKEEVYRRNKERFSDIIFKAKDGIAVLNDLDFPVVRLRSRNLVHDEKGILLIKGSNVIPGKRKMANIWDVAPTILHMLGVDPGGMDGKALKVFRKPFDKSGRSSRKPIEQGSEKDLIDDALNRIEL